MNLIIEKEKPILIEIEKALSQAKHRLEEAAACDRVKMRKARTRRLIVEGAILEKVCPQVLMMTPDEIKDYLTEKITEERT